METSHAKKILVYDGSCATCRVMKSAADMTVSNYDFIDSMSEKGKQLIAEKNLDIEKSAYLLENDRIASHSDMALAVLNDVRVIGPGLATIARIIPPRGRDAMYGWLVRHRIR